MSAEQSSRLDRKHCLGRPHGDNSEPANPGRSLSVGAGRAPATLSYFFPAGQSHSQFFSTLAVLVVGRVIFLPSLQPSFAKKPIVTERSREKAWVLPVMGQSFPNSRTEETVSELDTISVPLFPAVNCNLPKDWLPPQKSPENACISNTLS